jgi:hypothetical protein
MRAELTITSILALLGIATSALSPIIPKGSKFFYSNGSQFFIKGTLNRETTLQVLADNNIGVEYAYPSDRVSFASGEQCKIDAALMRTLGANSVRLTNATNADHSGCMTAFEQAGMYVWASLRGLGPDEYLGEVMTLAPTTRFH